MGTLCGEERCQHGLGVGFIYGLSVHGGVDGDRGRARKNEVTLEKGPGERQFSSDSVGHLEFLADSRGAYSEPAGR
jgi:hypothetical protein